MLLLSFEGIGLIIFRSGIGWICWVWQEGTGLGVIRSIKLTFFSSYDWHDYLKLLPRSLILTDFFIERRLGTLWNGDSLSLAGAVVAFGANFLKMTFYRLIFYFSEVAWSFKVILFSDSEFLSSSSNCSTFLTKVSI